MTVRAVMDLQLVVKAGHLGHQGQKVNKHTFGTSVSRPDDVGWVLLDKVRGGEEKKGGNCNKQFITLYINIHTHG